MRMSPRLRLFVDPPSTGRPRRNYCDGPDLFRAQVTLWFPGAFFSSFFFIFLFLFGSGTGYKYGVKVDVVSTCNVRHVVLKWSVILNGFI